MCLAKIGKCCWWNQQEQISLKSLIQGQWMWSRKNLGTTFSAGGLVDFLNNRKMLLICIVLHTISHFFFGCIRCYFEQNTRKLIVYLRNLLDNNNSHFISFISGNIFLSAHNLWPLPFSVWILPWRCVKFIFILWESISRPFSPLKNVSNRHLNFKDPSKTPFTQIH